MKKIFSILLISFIVISYGYSYSLDEQTPVSGNIIKIYSGEIKIINVDNPTKVVINNPDIVDVTSVAKNEMVLLGKTRGTTNLMWRDAKGEHLAQVDVLLENMGPVKERIDNILKEMEFASVFTRGLDSEGRVLLLGNVKTPQDIERINEALGPMKGKVINLIQVREEETVVAIDVQVLELDQDATKTLGFSWPGTTTITEVGSPSLAAAGTNWGSLFRVLNVSRGAFTLTLDALTQEGKARVLSQPRLSCQSGKEAELSVGGEKPILTTTVAATTGAEGTEVDYKEFGIKLKIKPTVTETKDIKLALNVEVSEVGTAEILGAANAPTAKAYPLTKRNASTELFLKDGQTMAIGGLKKQKSEEDIRKVPILGDIPIVGFLFRKKTTQAGGGQSERGDVELFITLTPTIVKEHMEAEEAVGQEDQAEPVASQEVAKEEALVKTESSLEEKQQKPEAQKPPASPLSEYILSVSRQISSNIVYPWAARQANIEGSLKLALHLYYTGQLLDVQIRESSGYAVLDENAASTVRIAAPYPPFTPEMKQRELWIDLPIVYKTK
ncbi:MAG: TonB family protein [Candidatus Omnitrophota bacterium]|jgi:pilus assembly protein CpaC